ncbi:MAG: helix-turn-helix transcriptional regulator [Sphingomonas sp.]
MADDRSEFPADVTVSSLSEIAALVGDPGRTNMLLALLDGLPLTARQLADVAGVMPQTASGHIAKLSSAGLIVIDRVGRTHQHRLASDQVAQMLLSLAKLARRPDRPNGQDHGARHIDLARICQGHVAGRLGVELWNAWHEERAQGGSDLISRLRLWGVPVGLDRQLDDDRHAQRCLDWTEQRPHLGGHLGAAILSRGLDTGWLMRSPGTRTLTITGIGLRGFRERLGIALPD